MLEVLNVEQELLDVCVLLVLVWVDVVVVSYVILLFMGLLIVDYFGLNVEEYDVIGYYQCVLNVFVGIIEQGVVLDCIFEVLQKQNFCN